jgi:hypothetical protein
MQRRAACRLLHAASGHACSQEQTKQQLLFYDLLWSSADAKLGMCKNILLCSANFSARRCVQHRTTSHSHFAMHEPHITPVTGQMTDVHAKPFNMCFHRIVLVSRSTAIQRRRNAPGEDNTWTSV